MKKALPLIIASCLVLSACAGETDGDVASISETPIESDTSKETTTSTESSTSTETSVEESEEAGYTLEDLSKYTYEFSSGAGGWSTSFTIEADGSFKGNYHDSELGDTGEGYENGTVVYADFTGHFSELTKVSDYVYEMTMLDISYDKENGTEEITDGVRYSYVNDAYGLTGTVKFLVYIPGAAVSGLSEDVYSWVQWSVNGSDTLATPVIENVDQKEGIYSYERMSAAEEAESTYNNYLSIYNSHKDSLSSAATQTEMEEESRKMYDAADNCLNELWNLVKYNVSDYDTVLNEQLAWISDKEAKADAAKSEYEGGSLANTVYNQTAAEMTMDRCKELLDLLK